MDKNYSEKVFWLFSETIPIFGAITFENFYMHQRIFPVEKFYFRTQITVFGGIFWLIMIVVENWSKLKEYAIIVLFTYFHQSCTIFLLFDLMSISKMSILRLFWETGSNEILSVTKRQSLKNRSCRVLQPIKMLIICPPDYIS